MSKEKDNERWKSAAMGAGIGTAVPSTIIVEETIGQHYEHVGCGGLIKAPLGEEGFCYGCEKKGKVVLDE